MSKGLITRAAILEQALSLASRIGLEGLSIGLLAEETGMSKSGLFAHFGSKEALQIAVLEEASRRFLALVIAPALAKPRGEPQLRELFDRWLAWDRESTFEGGCIFVTAAVELDDRPGPVRDRLVELQRTYLETLARTARAAVKEGHFRPDVDPEQLAFEMYGIALVYHHQTHLLREPRAERRARTAFDALLRSAHPTP